MTDTPTWARQHGFSRRMEWGAAGAQAIADAGVVVVVDVLRFSTAVEAATANGAAVYPYRWRDDSAATFANSIGATLAHADAEGPSLSPTTLLHLRVGDALVLPSPNGSTCAALAQDAGAQVVAGCLRNASAMGTWLQTRDEPIAVIACGERWPDGSLRPAVEDLLGAGAILSRAGGQPSPEARAAIAAWKEAEGAVEQTLLDSPSGRELVERGLREDVCYAAETDVSDVIPVLSGGAFRRAS